jgi:hypothetical protein
MARMLGKVSPPWCNVCKAPPGPDCPDGGRDKRQVRARERRDLAEIVEMTDDLAAGKHERPAGSGA